MPCGFLACLGKGVLAQLTPIPNGMCACPMMHALFGVAIGVGFAVTQAARGMSGLHMAEMVVGIARSALFDDKVSKNFTVLEQCDWLQTTVEISSQQDS